MTDLKAIKAMLRTYGIKSEKELDVALEKNLNLLNVGAMTCPVNIKQVGQEDCMKLSSVCVCCSKCEQYLKRKCLGLLEYYWKDCPVSRGESIK